jgi:hypothetical protein
MYSLPDLPGPMIMHVLSDLLIWTSGPGLRDKLSHGMARPEAVPSAYSHLLVYVSILLFKKFVPGILWLDKFQKIS